ncbi:hypothetical protein O3P69_018771 [Scylla paramamosain]|uniref:Single domain-containing protein n=1 Tax=Scylla paramamosain TaxID=85552 RepID=A0AAW0SRL6_SCYPA
MRAVVMMVVVVVVAQVTHTASRVTLGHKKRFGDKKKVTTSLSSPSSPTSFSSFSSSYPSSSPSFSSSSSKSPSPSSSSSSKSPSSSSSSSLASFSPIFPSLSSSSPSAFPPRPSLKRGCVVEGEGREVGEGAVEGLGEGVCGVRRCLRRDDQLILQEERCTEVHNPNYTCLELEEPQKPFPHCCKRLSC